MQEINQDLETAGNEVMKTVGALRAETETLVAETQAETDDDEAYGWFNTFLRIGKHVISIFK